MIQQITILALLSTCAAHIIDRRDPKDRPTPLSNSRLIDNYEQWLMNQFVAQLDETLPLDPRGSPEMDPESQKTMGNRNPGVNDGYGSHTISTTLEMFTRKPLNEKSGKLITADDMKLFDPPVAPIEKKETAERLFFFRLPTWQLLLASIPSVIFLLLIALTLIALFRVRRRNASRMKQMPAPYMISGAHTLPDSTNTPQSFLDRLNRMQHLDTVVREREHSEIWTRRETGPLTATTTLETLYRV
ncbi:hypothetical protein Q1695_011718 [Nippostrongylus brasiliensis]|nr:hypothetical protein Q1695_011718 [Nippostrongylus brasiliensis]